MEISSQNSSSMDQVTQGIMQLSPKNLPQWRFHYFWATYTSACLPAWLENSPLYPAGTLLPEICIYHLLLFVHLRDGFMPLLCNPSLGNARLLSAPSQPSLPSLSRSCSLSLFLHITGSRPWTLLVPLQFVKMCHVLGAKTGHSTLDVNSQARKRIALLDQLAMPLPVQPSGWLVFLET